MLDFCGSFTHFRTNELLNYWLTFSFSLLPMLDTYPVCWVEARDPSSSFWEYCWEMFYVRDCCKLEEDS